MELIQHLDRSLLLGFNALHTEWLDLFFSTITNRFTWIPLYLVLLILLIKKYRRAFWVPILCIIGMITLSDQLASTIFKPWIERLRPCHDDSIKNLIYLVNNYCGGAFGFYSSHASNTAALAVFWGLRTGKVWAVALGVYALLNGLSRIYLGVHYPSDILVGIVAGSCCALIFHWVEKRIQSRLQSQ